MVEELGHPITLAPKYIPIEVRTRLLPAATLESLIDAVAEAGLEADRAIPTFALATLLRILEVIGTTQLFFVPHSMDGSGGLPPTILKALPTMAPWSSTAFF
jgi:hypothetical protein